MRISDWSSDVCSSDLKEGRGGEGDRQAEHNLDQSSEAARRLAKGKTEAGHDDDHDGDDLRHRALDRFKNRIERAFPRSEERRVGKDGVGRCRSRWEQYL